jgi:hypothetical protein
MASAKLEIRYFIRFYVIYHLQNIHQVLVIPNKTISPNIFCAHEDTLGANLAAAVSKKELFSSKSVRRTWLGSTDFNFL